MPTLTSFENGFHLPVNKVSRVMALDMLSRVREGENMLVMVDAHSACLSMLNAVELLLSELQSMALANV
jgi:dihydroxyacetone kinase DhaKLM complex PTS-EIIA-like component DhaM